VGHGSKPHVPGQLLVVGSSRLLRELDGPLEQATIHVVRDHALPEALQRSIDASSSWNAGSSNPCGAADERSCNTRRPRSPATIPGRKVIEMIRVSNGAML
jgi:hypothetical protein